MLLTTASAGVFSGGAGGMMMAHQPNMMAAAPPPPQATGIPHSSSTAPPLSYVALGADLLDRQQSQLSFRRSKNVAAMPIVAVDLFGADTYVATFPPKQQPNQPSNDEEIDLSPLIVGKMKAKLLLKASDTSHKTLRSDWPKAKVTHRLQQMSWLVPMIHHHTLSWNVLNNGWVYNE